MSITSRLAVIDDEPRMAEILGMVLRRDGHGVSTFASGPAFLEAMALEPFDLVVTDLRMEPMDGLAVLDAVRERAPDVPVVLVTAHATVQTAIAAMRAGAFDYIEKPFDNDLCRATVRRALEMTRLARENRYLRAELRERHAVPEAIASSSEMHAVFELARRAANSRATVLVSGESGTGKELVARAIHYHSDRVGRPFVAVNLKALSSGVLESELFGHVRGAYTGASGARRGLFERADGGTLLLDEIGEIDLEFQARLLRVLQEREVVPVGGDTPRQVDVRIVAATNRDLAADVRSGRFRDDLFFRLNVIPIQVPPLRERRDDILLLARHFAARFADELGKTVAGFAPDVERFLLHHDWPGNVRELENTMERAVVLARGATLELDDLLVDAARLTASPRTVSPAAGLDELPLNDFVDRMTAEHIRRALEACDGRRVDAAERLGIERTTLYRLMKRLQLA